jgi:ubiquinol-cytochrome c reductase cytochrome b subunit
VLVAFFCLFLAASFLDAPLERVADPTDTSYVPRPEWYFLFLFQLLKMFPGRLELIGTLVIPSLAVLVLVLLPFLNPAHATVLRGRLRSFAVLASVFGIWAGLTAMAGWTPPRARAHEPLFAQPADWVRIAPEVIAGAGFFQTLHCGACHDLIVGTPKPGPSLGVAGIEHPREWLLEHFDAESKLSLPERNALVIFVASLNPGSLRAITSIPASFSRGAQIYVASACASCHKVNGTGGNFGPALNGVAERRSDAWVHAHFLAPQRLSPKSVMPPYRFSTDDEKALTSYLFSLPN